METALQVIMHSQLQHLSSVNYTHLHTYATYMRRIHVAHTYVYTSPTHTHTHALMHALLPILGTICKRTLHTMQALMSKLESYTHLCTNSQTLVIHTYTLRTIMAKSELHRNRDTQKQRHAGTRIHTDGATQTERNRRRRRCRTCVVMYLF